MWLDQPGAGGAGLFSWGQVHGVDHLLLLCAVPLCFHLREWLWPITESLSGDTMLDLVFAVFRRRWARPSSFDIGASTGGNRYCGPDPGKYTSMEIGRALMVSDILIVPGRCLAVWHWHRTVLYPWA